MARNEKPTCGSCKFYEGNGVGSCCRFPKIVLKTNTDWCGEHKKS